jgi:hypothetical protein
LSSDDRKHIKARLLKSHAMFWKQSLPWSAPNPTHFMLLAFDGIAEVLFDAGLLTHELLQGELRLLVLESAIAGGWWPTYEEHRKQVLPGLLGHSLEWCKLDAKFPELFAAKAAEWRVRLLEGTGVYLGRPELPTKLLGRITAAERDATERLKQALLPYSAANPKFVRQPAEVDDGCWQSAVVCHFTAFAKRVFDAQAREYLRIYPERVKSGNLLKGEIGPGVMSSTKFQWTRWYTELRETVLDWWHLDYPREPEPDFDDTDPYKDEPDYAVDKLVKHFWERLNSTVSKRIVFWQTRPAPVTAKSGAGSENAVVTPSMQPPEGRPTKPADRGGAVLKRGRKTAFAPLQLQTAREMKQAGKRNQEIAKVLWGINAPTANQRRSVPTILRYHFPQDRGSSRGRSKQ